jgi:16S rRNA (guanine966-N2)-methyltransferase
MRVITGLARGRKLKTLEGNDVRPTADRVKEGMFSAIQFDIEGRKVLDLFAGSGQLGIEALSRGAEIAVFTDQSPKSIEIIKENVKNCNLEKNSRVLQTSAEAFLLGRGEKFDIAFLDPPYNHDIIPAVMPYLIPRMADHGIIICEYASNEKMPDNFEDFIKQKEYRYGKVSVSIFRR